MLSILTRLGLIRLFLLAILIRLLIMPFYFHPDIKTYHFQAQFLKEGVFNIYSYLTENKDRLPIREEFVYFPLTYFFLGGYQLIATPLLLGPHFFDWLNDASQAAGERIGLYRYLFVLKFPYLIFDLIIPFLLIRFLNNYHQQRQIFLLWLFNPLSIFVIYIFSNVDIIPVVLSLISFLFFRQRKFITAAMLLGLSAGFKPYTLLYLPFLLLFHKSIKEVVLTAAIAISTLILIVAPFWSNAFLHSALISGLTTRITFPGVTIGFGETLMVSVVTMTALFFWTLRNRPALENFWYYILSLLLLLFSTIHYHIQWLLWIVPFMIMFAVLKEQLSKLTFLWLFLSFLIPILYDDKFMNVSLLSVISPLYTLLPTVFTEVQKIYDPYALQSVIHSILFALSLILIWNILKLEKR